MPIADKMKGSLFAGEPADEFPSAESNISIDVALAPSGGDLVNLVGETIDLFARRGMSAEDLAPLFRLQNALRDRSQLPPAASAERVASPNTNEVLLGRACVVIDLMTFAGDTSEKAAQTIARQLRATDVCFSGDGGDVRAWKRLLNFRLALLHGSKTEHVEARDAYKVFKDHLSHIPAERRVQFALESFKENPS